MSGQVFIIADLHFGHLKLAQVRGFNTIEDHDNHLITNWNNIVDKRDVVYVLGDVFSLDNVSKLNGIKKLALGNHDKKSIDKYTELFSKVAAYFEYDNCILSHIPVHESQFPRWEFNIHGHTHERTIKDPRYVSVSVEQTGMKPISLNKLIDNKRKEIIYRKDKMAT